eukprot:11339452-Heterocapsa_arctica.AAC.1
MIIELQISTCPYCLSSYTSASCHRTSSTAGREYRHPLELARREDLDLSVEAHVEVPGLVAIEHLAEEVHEDVRAESVAHDHEATRLVGHHLHL